MKAKDLLESIGAIDDQYISEADPQTAQKKPKRGVWMRWSIAAAFVFTFLATLFFWGRQKAPRWPIREVPMHITSDMVEIDVDVIPKWEELSVSEQYHHLQMGAMEYGGTTKALSLDQIGESLGNYTLSGFDEHNDTTHTNSGNVFKIAGISSDCAVAVQFANDESFYVYCNSDYRPETLGQFLKDLNLEETIRFGKAYYPYRKPNGAFATVEFEGVQKEDVLQMLLSDTTAPNVEDYDSMQFSEAMSLSVDLPLLGYENVSLAVTEDGYLTTNLLDTGKAFFIGTDKVDAFIEHVLETCEGYEIVYVTEDAPSEPPESGSDSSAMTSAVTASSFVSSVLPAGTEVESSVTESTITGPALPSSAREGTANRQVE